MKQSYIRPVISFTAFILLSMQFYAQTQELKNLSFEVEGDNVKIYYELIGDVESEYEIEVILKRTGDPSFVLIPKELTGDVGEGKFAGGKRKIIWKLKPDEKVRLEGEDFYFSITASKIEVTAGIPWYYYVGGAVVGGVIAVITLIGGGEDEKPPTTTEFPSPPGRP